MMMFSAPHHCCRNARHDRIARRPAFTLVELLIVVMVIGILATIVLIALAGAQEAGRTARTKAQIAKIASLLDAHWESYRTRRINQNFVEIFGLPNSNVITIFGNKNRNRQALQRVKAIYALMRLELPDRITDIPENIVPGQPALVRGYRKRIKSTWTPQYQGAECLYLILASMHDGDSNGLEYFQDNEIGDVDNDGMREILDGWGHPIEFLRWAPGFSSPLQSFEPQGRNRKPSKLLLAQQSPNTFDPTNIYAAELEGILGQTPAHYALFPLIFSAGSDGLYHIATDMDESVNYDNTNPPNYPYAKFGSRQIGESIPVDKNGYRDGHIDNLHNHLLGTEAR